MPRESTITFEQVSAAANGIKAQGGKATTRAVREVLGSGSMATICKFLQQWRANQLRQNQCIDDNMNPLTAIASKRWEIITEVAARLTNLQTRVRQLEIDAAYVGAEIEKVRVELLQACAQIEQ